MGGGASSSMISWDAKISFALEKYPRSFHVSGMKKQRTGDNKEKFALEDNAKVIGEKAAVLRWYTDPRSVMLVLLAILIPLTLPAFRVLNDRFDWMHPLLVALAAGLTITFLCLPICVWADQKYGISTAGAIGLLSALFCAYGAPMNGVVVSPMLISFFVFHILFAYAESALVWPKNYQKYVSKETP